MRSPLPARMEAAGAPSAWSQTLQSTTRATTPMVRRWVAEGGPEGRCPRNPRDPRTTPASRRVTRSLGHALRSSSILTGRPRRPPPQSRTLGRPRRPRRPASQESAFPEAHEGVPGTFSRRKESQAPCWRSGAANRAQLSSPGDTSPQYLTAPRNNCEAPDRTTVLSALQGILTRLGTSVALGLGERRPP